MIGLGLFFLVIGAISEWVIQNKEVVGGQVFNMNDVGWIFIFVGILALVLGGLMSLTRITETGSDVIEDESGRRSRQTRWTRKGKE